LPVNFNILAVTALNSSSGRRRSSSSSNNDNDNNNDNDDNNNNNNNDNNNRDSFISLLFHYLMGQKKVFCNSSKVFSSSIPQVITCYLL